MQEGLSQNRLKLVTTQYSRSWAVGMAPSCKEATVHTTTRFLHAVL